MADSSRQIADLEREMDRLVKVRTDAWDRLDALKDGLQKADRNLEGNLEPAERRGLEQRRMDLSLAYVRTDRQIHDISGRMLDLSETYRTLKGMPVPTQEELLRDKDSLEARLQDSREKALELSGSLIGRKHHQMEAELLGKELAQVNRKLGMGGRSMPDDDLTFRGRDLADDFDMR